jgi:MacB-like periplasmic core domain
VKERFAPAAPSVPAAPLAEVDRKGQTSGVEFRELQSFTDVFSAVAAMEDRAWTLLADGAASRLVGEGVTPDFFRVFDEDPLVGRFSTADDHELSVVLSDRVWRSQFGGNTSAVGSVITLDGKLYRVAARVRF